MDSQIRYFRRLFPTAELRLQCGYRQICCLPVELLAGFDLPPHAEPDLFSQIYRLEVSEQGYLKGGLKRRVIHTIYLLPGAEPCYASS